MKLIAWLCTDDKSKCDENNKEPEKKKSYQKVHLASRKDISGLRFFATQTGEPEFGFPVGT